MKIKDLIHEMFSAGNLNLEVPINDTKDFDGNYVELNGQPTQDVTSHNQPTYQNDKYDGYL